MPGFSYPLTFAPVYKDYLWGGNRLARRLGRAVPTTPCAESWELTDRPEGMSVVRAGPWRGTTLGALVTEQGPALVGDAAPAGRFPLLLKILDVGQRTSLQVHPSQGTVRQTGGEPKAELWYMLPESEPSRVFLGLRPGVTRAAFLAALDEGDPAALVNPIPVRPGEAVFVPGGLLHAADAGCLFYEVQLNSDTTFRVSDWGRVGPDGRPRPLHLVEAGAAIDWEDRGGGVLEAIRVPPAREAPDARGENLRRCLLPGPPFRVEELRLAAPWKAATEARSFEALFVVAGAVRIVAGEATTPLPSATTCLLPASLGPYRIEPDPAEQAATLLRITL